MAKCKSCGKPIVWIKTTRGKMMPCDPTPAYYRTDQGGTAKIVTPNGEVITCELDEQIPSGIGYIPHWVTCPRCKDFKNN
jgi:hypothetical protein